MIVGIDPGKTGAIARLTNDGKLIDVIDTPVAGNDVSSVLIANYLRVYEDEIACAVVEFVSARPGQSAPAMWRFGVGYGKVLGVLATLEIPIIDVTPSKWKKAMGLDSDKEKSRQRALQLWPDKADLFRRKKDEGRAEAALMGLWYIRDQRQEVPAQVPVTPKRTRVLRRRSIP